MAERGKANMNKGGMSIALRGEMLGVVGGAIIDWLTVTFKPVFEENIGLVLLNWLRTLSLDRFGQPVRLVAEDCPGVYGYAMGVRLYAYVVLADGVKSVNVGRIDWGGTKHQGRARLDLSGAGCALIKDWEEVQEQIESWQDVTITRVDLAVDCLNGEYSIEDARDWYQAGEFNAGGRMPRHSTPGDWLAEGSPHGRTLEVGRRENGKMLRVYEKGKQLGDKQSPWTRFEIEIRNKDREIPLDILTNRDTYFTGAYKCLEQILDAGATRIATQQKEGQISAEKLTYHAKTAYGGLVNVLRLHLTADEICKVLSRPTIPARLDKASLAGLSDPESVLRDNLLRM